MKILPRFLLVLSTLLAHQLITVKAVAQDDEEQPGKNIIKTNLPGFALRNYNLTYERMLSKKTSFNLGFRTMPSGPVLFKDRIISSIEDAGSGTNVDARKEVESIRMSNFAVTPEIRFYAGKKGYGHGFYFSLFYRYARHEIGNISVDYDNNAGTTSTATLTGSLTSNTGGFMLGSQWVMGKRVVLDWWILGPHFGVAKGTLTGTNSTPISTADQNSLQTEIEDVLAAVPFVKNVIDVNANGAKVSLSGPWAGVRGGLSLGIRF
ncbi:MAG: hypothetical protein RL151_267 [Bacteroidota bacterium]